MRVIRLNFRMGSRFVWAKKCCGTITTGRWVRYSQYDASEWRTQDRSSAAASAQSHRGKDARPDVHRLLHRGLHVCGGLHHVRRDGEPSREPPQISKAFAGFGREVDQGARHKKDEFVHQQVGEGSNPMDVSGPHPAIDLPCICSWNGRIRGTIQTNATGEATSQAGRFGSLGSILSTRRTRAKPSTSQHRCHKNHK